jgi:hypothetical protein
MPSLRTATSSIALPGRRKETKICHNNFYQSNDSWPLLTLTMNVRSWPLSDHWHGEVSQGMEIVSYRPLADDQSTCKIVLVFRGWLRDSGFLYDFPGTMNDHASDQ